MSQIELRQLLAAARSHSDAVLHAMEQDNLELAITHEIERFESFRALARWREAHEIDDSMRAYFIDQMLELGAIDSRLGEVMQGLREHMRRQLQALQNKRKSSRAYAQVALR